MRSTPPSIAASRDGDFDAVAGHTATYAKLYSFVIPALVNGAAGAVVAPGGTRVGGEKGEVCPEVTTDLAVPPVEG